MKYLIASVVLCFGLTAAASEIQVHKLSLLSGMERSFKLHTRSISDLMVLDCQSFVQGLTIGKKPHETFFFLDPQECEELYERVSLSLDQKKKHCLEVGDSIHADYTCP